MAAVEPLPAIDAHQGPSTLTTKPPTTPGPRKIYPGAPPRATNQGPGLSRIQYSEHFVNPEDPFEHRHYRPYHPTCNKILAKRWEDHTRDIHLMKLKLARPTIDNAQPRVYSHLEMRLKRMQVEEERLRDIERKNHILLDRIAFQMMNPSEVSNLRWVQTPSEHKPAISAGPSPKRKRDIKQISQENMTILQRIEDKAPYYNRLEWLANRRQNLGYLFNIAQYPKTYIRLLEEGEAEFAILRNTGSKPYNKIPSWQKYRKHKAKKNDGSARDADAKTANADGSNDAKGKTRITKKPPAEPAAAPAPAADPDATRLLGSLDDFDLGIVDDDPSTVSNKRSNSKSSRPSSGWSSFDNAQPSEPTSGTSEPKKAEEDDEAVYEADDFESGIAAAEVKAEPAKVVAVVAVPGVDVDAEALAGGVKEAQPEERAVDEAEGQPKEEHSEEPKAEAKSPEPTAEVHAESADAEHPKPEPAADPTPRASRPTTAGHATAPLPPIPAAAAGPNQYQQSKELAAAIMGVDVSIFASKPPSRPLSTVGDNLPHGAHPADIMDTTAEEEAFQLLQAKGELPPLQSEKATPSSRPISGRERSVVGETSRPGSGKGEAQAEAGQRDEEKGKEVSSEGGAEHQGHSNPELLAPLGPDAHDASSVVAGSDVGSPADLAGHAPETEKIHDDGKVEALGVHHDHHDASSVMGDVLPDHELQVDGVHEAEKSEKPVSHTEAAHAEPTEKSDALHEAGTEQTIEAEPIEKADDAVEDAAPEDIAAPEQTEEDAKDVEEKAGSHEAHDHEVPVHASNETAEATDAVVEHKEVDHGEAHVNQEAAITNSEAHAVEENHEGVITADEVPEAKHDSVQKDEHVVESAEVEHPQVHEHSDAEREGLASEPEAAHDVVEKQEEAAEPVDVSAGEDTTGPGSDGQGGVQENAESTNVAKAAGDDKAHGTETHAEEFVAERGHEQQEKERNEGSEPNEHVAANSEPVEAKQAEAHEENHQAETHTAEAKADEAEKDPAVAAEEHHGTDSEDLSPAADAVEATGETHATKANADEGERDAVAATEGHQGADTEDVSHTAESTSDSAEAAGEKAHDEVVEHAAHAKSDEHHFSAEEGEAKPEESGTLGQDGEHHHDGAEKKETPDADGQAQSEEHKEPAHEAAEEHKPEIEEGSKTDERAEHQAASGQVAEAEASHANTPVELEAGEDAKGIENPAQEAAELNNDKEENGAEHKEDHAAQSQDTEAPAEAIPSEEIKHHAAEDEPSTQAAQEHTDPPQQAESVPINADEVTSQPLATADVVETETSHQPPNTEQPAAEEELLEFVHDKSEHPAEEKGHDKPAEPEPEIQALGEEDGYGQLAATGREEVMADERSADYAFVNEDEGDKQDANGNVPDDKASANHELDDSPPTEQATQPTPDGPDETITQPTESEPQPNPTTDAPLEPKPPSKPASRAGSVASQRRPASKPATRPGSSASIARAAETKPVPTPPRGAPSPAAAARSKQASRASSVRSVAKAKPEEKPADKPASRAASVRSVARSEKAVDAKPAGDVKSKPVSRAGSVRSVTKSVHKPAEASASPAARSKQASRAGSVRSVKGEKPVENELPVLPAQPTEEVSN
ncbi:hypothetical protein HDU96_007613 [Phlyctochytrium bullatum]|nr:hypothetical protein HDU96_007613 [Phlyctochytrium bullatum]